MCKITQELNLPPAMVLRNCIFNLFMLPKLHSGVKVDTGYFSNLITAIFAIELSIAKIKSLNRGLSLHITIHSNPLLPPSFDLRFEFGLRDVHVTAEVAVNIINGII